MGYSNKTTGYGAYARFVNGMGKNDYTPSFKCPQKNDAFTVNDTENGNGNLIYPISIITADEVVAAGSGKAHTNNTSYYLYNSKAGSWILSPFSYTIGNGMGFITNLGSVGYTPTDSGRISINVVLNIKSNYFKKFIGTGTMTDPYRAEGVAP